MLDFAATVLLFVVLLGSALVGYSAQRRLHHRHVSRDTFESVRLLMGMLLTFSALVLGLLVTSAKERFDGYSRDLGIYAADLIELDHRLRTFGPDAEDIRNLLRRYTAAAIADTWPTEPLPFGDYPRKLQETNGVEAATLGEMLDDIDMRIQRLAPADIFHRQIAERLRNRAGETLQRRWQIILSAPSTIAWPFLFLLSAWLSAIFAIFALTAPRDELVYVVIALAALMIATPFYFILEYSGAQSGLVRLPSDSMRTALIHMDRKSR